MDRDSFSLWWDKLSAVLKPDTEVPHWSAHGQYEDESFNVLRVESDGVWIDISRPTLPVGTKRLYTLAELGTYFENPALGDTLGKLVPTNREHYLKKELFLNALIHWSEYCKPVISRADMDGKIGGQSTYVISIIHWMEERRLSF